METAVLERIGLTHGEIKAYLALLKLGPSAAGAIAKQASVSRSKIYMVVEKLEKKGLASHADKRGVRYFHAVEPSKITDYLKERKEDIERMETEFHKFLPKLQAYHREAGKGHHVTTYEGIKGLKVAHEHLYLKLRKGDWYCALGAPGAEIWKETNRYWVNDHRRRAAAGIGCRILFNAGVEREVVEHRNKQALCEARYMPSEMVTPAEIEVFGDTTLIITISEEPVTIEIVSAQIADSFIAYFNQVWKMSKPFK